MIDQSMSLWQIERIAALLRQLDAGSIPPATERRRRPRLPFRSTTQLRLLDQPGAPQVRVFTRNMSTRGISFIGQCPINVGERLVIMLRAGGLVSKAMLCTVIYRRQVCDGIHEFGASFISVLNPERRHQPKAAASAVPKGRGKIRQPQTSAQNKSARKFMLEVFTRA